jgi:AraC-like DNA-binding protein
LGSVYASLNADATGPLNWAVCERPFSYIPVMASGRPYWDFPRGLGSIRLLLEVGGEWGVPARVCLSGTGLSPGDIDRPDRLVEAEQAVRAIRNLTEATGDPPGLGAAVGVRLKLSSLGAWGILLSSCQTIADVIRVGPRYYELSENFLRPSLEYQVNAVVLVYADDEVPEDIRGFMIERDLAYNVTSVQALVGASTPLHMTARLPAERTAALAALLPGFEIVGQSTRNAIHLPRLVLQQRLISADADTHRCCLAHCDEILGTLHNRDSVANRVRAVLLRSAPGLLGLDQVAHEFHVDARTLRRWLVEEATSYRTLVDEVRERRAIELLDAPGGTVRQTASHLGYASVASFTRAFRRWTGETPAAWTREHASVPPVRFGQRSVRTRLSERT